MRPEKKKNAKQNHQAVSQGGNAASNSVGNSSGKLGSKYSQCPRCSRAAEGDAGRSRGVCERRGVGIRGVRGPGRDVRHHPVQTLNCEYRSTSQRRWGTRDKVCLPCPSTGERSSRQRPWGAARFLTGKDQSWGGGELPATGRFFPRSFIKIKLTAQIVYI